MPFLTTHTEKPDAPRVEASGLEKQSEVDQK